MTTAEDIAALDRQGVLDGIAKAIIKADQLAEKEAWRGLLLQLLDRDTPKEPKP